MSKIPHNLFCQLQLIESNPIMAGGVKASKKRLLSKFVSTNDSRMIAQVGVDFQVKEVCRGY